MTVDERPLSELLLQTLVDEGSVLLPCIILRGTDSLQQAHDTALDT